MPPNVTFILVGEVAAIGFKDDVASNDGRSNPNPPCDNINISIFLSGMDNNRRTMHTHLTGVCESVLNFTAGFLFVS